MNLTKSGKSRGRRVAALIVRTAAFVAIATIGMLIGVILWPAPHIASTPRSTVTVQVTVVDFTKNIGVDYLKQMSTGESLDLAEEYQALLGRRLSFTTTTEKAMQNAEIHAVAPFGKYCVLGFSNTPGETVKIVVASRYNDGLTAELYDVPLHGSSVSADIDAWFDDCITGKYQAGQLPNWMYAGAYEEVRA